MSIKSKKPRNYRIINWSLLMSLTVTGILVLSSCRFTPSKPKDDTQKETTYKISYGDGAIEILDEKGSALNTTIRNFKASYTWSETLGFVFAIDTLEFLVGTEWLSLMVGSYKAEDLTFKVSQQNTNTSELSAEKFAEICAQSLKLIKPNDSRDANALLETNATGKTFRYKVQFAIYEQEKTTYRFEPVGETLAAMNKYGVQFSFWGWGPTVDLKMKGIPVGTLGTVSGKLNSFVIAADSSISFAIQEDKDFDFQK